MGVEGDTQACRGPALGTPSGGGFYFWSVTRPTPVSVFHPFPQRAPLHCPRSCRTSPAAAAPRELPTPGEAPSGVGDRRSEL